MDAGQANLGSSTSTRPTAAESHDVRAEAPRWGWAAVGVYFLIGLLRAVDHLGPEHFGLMWDDALFFKRVGYNIVHHGVASWNPGEGALFVNTSQVFQGFAALFVWLFPNHYSAAVTFWGAVALALSMGLLLASRRQLPGRWVSSAVLLFCLFQAPPVMLSLTTGMETPTVLLVLSLYVYAFQRWPATQHVFVAVFLQVLVYATRPDAILLSLGASSLHLLLQRELKSLAAFLGLTLLALAVLSALYYLYYGTPVPLSAYLKVSPFSIYDAQYLSADAPNKAHNLTQIALVALPLVPLIALAFDRTAAALCAPVLVFIAYHGLVTYEIAAYHARFYAPATPLLFAAALRSLPSVHTPRRLGIVFAWSSLSAGLSWVAFNEGWVENQHGYGPDIVPFVQYAAFACGVPAVSGALLLRHWVRGFSKQRSHRVLLRAQLALSCFGVCALVALPLSAALPSSWTIVSDTVSNHRTNQRSRGSLGAEIIQQCFPPRVQVAHSEIGLPGVLFPEARIIDFTGLANPSIVDGSFDFDKLCSEERPEFVYHPHWTHRRLNHQLNTNACMRRNYRRVNPRQRTCCPLLVRKDLVQQYKSCRLGQR